MTAENGQSQVTQAEKRRPLPPSTVLVRERAPRFPIAGQKRLPAMQNSNYRNTNELRPAVKLCGDKICRPNALPRYSGAVKTTLRAALDRPSSADRRRELHKLPRLPRFVGRRHSRCVNRQIPQIPRSRKTFAGFRPRQRPISNGDLSQNLFSPG